MKSSSDQMFTPLALRMDDVGASSKRYEVYSNRKLSLGGRTVFSGNWLFFKYLDPFRGWGPYRELAVEDWEFILNCLEKYSAKLTVAITAGWASSENHWVPFDKKFPGEAEIIKTGIDRNIIEVANHGLSHSVLKGNAFHPKWFSGNRQYHREFWEWVPIDEQEIHIARAQEILQSYFGRPITTFVPPGNIFTEKTLSVAAKYGIKYVSCNVAPAYLHGVYVLGNENTLTFHDRDIVLRGQSFFDSQLNENRNRRMVFVSDLGKAAESLRIQSVQK